MGKTPTISAGPVSGNDFFSVTEDQVAAGALIFNVVANDAKKAALYSLDNATVADLLQEDAPGIAELSALGNLISVTSDGKVAYGAGLDASLIQGLAAGETITDSFRYAFRQGANLVWQTVTVTITGTNDAPVARTDTGLGIEDLITSGSVALNDSDADHNAVLNFAATGNVPAGFAMASDGSWTLDASDPSYQALSSGESINLAVAYTVTDEHGASSNSTLVLTIVGTNDAPVTTSPAAEVAEGATTSGQLTALDADHDAALSFAVTGDAPAGFSLGADGSWAFDASGSAYDGLAEGEIRIVEVPFTVTDDHGASASSQLIIAVTGTNDGPSITSSFVVVDEDGTTAGQLTSNDPDNNAALTYALIGEAPTGFSLNPDGSWTFDASGSEYQSLSQGESRELNIDCSVTDEYGAAGLSSVTMIVLGTNDGPVAIGQAVSATIELYPAATTLTGQVTATDADAGAQLTYAMQGFVPDGFVMNPDGSWSWTLPLQEGIELNEGQLSAGQLSFVATDEYGATSTGVLQISLVGSNDAPVRDDAFASATEDQVITGTYHGVDPDLGAVLTYQLDPQSDPGFTIASDGSWQFDAGNPAYQALAAGETRQVVAGIIVTDEHGASVLSGLFVTVTGTDDGPPETEIGGTTSGAVIEARYGSAGTPTAAGTLTIVGDDPHFAAVGSPTASTGGYGKFTITADGLWQYNLDNFNSTVNGLNSGQTLSDSFIVYAADGTAQQIDVLIRGATDWVTISTYPNTNDPNNLDSNLGPAGTDNFNTIVIGTSAGEIVTGGSLNQTFDMQGGNDTVYAQGGDDTVYGGSGDDFIAGQAGNDFLNGDIGNDTMYGGSGNDAMFGNDGMDTLRGGSGFDNITGGAGLDVIIGGYGFDQLTGGADADAFVYNSVFDSGDVILDFQKGIDTIDLRAIDPNSQQAGDQAFAFSADGAAAYSIWLVQNGSNLEIYADTDGFAGTADFMITLQNVTLSTAALPANFLI